MILRLILLFFLLLAVNVFLSAQSLQQIEDSVNHYLSIIGTERGDARQQADESLRRLLRTSMLKAEAFNHPFESVKAMNTMHAPDRAFRIFNWNIPLEDDLHAYSCIIVTHDVRQKMSKVFELKPAKEPFTTQSTHTERNWPAALYYDIIPVKQGSQQYYILLGWDGNTAVSNRKLAEVLHFQSGKPRFGLPIFRQGKKTQKRLIFEYKEDAIFSLVYSDDLKAVVFDHLGPLHPSLEGQYSQYVPMQTFDGYFQQKGIWEFQADVDYRRGKGEKDRPWNAPSKPDMNRKRNAANPLVGE